MILLILVIAIIFLIFQKNNERFGRKCMSKWCIPLTKKCWEPCIDLPDIPNADGFFNQIKTDVEGLVNKAINPIKDIANNAKNSIEKVSNTVPTMIETLKEMKFESM